jgi:hypothetical protein
MARDKPNQDGEQRGWVDGKLVIESTDLVFRSADFLRMKFNQFMMLPYFHHDVPMTRLYGSMNWQLGRDGLGTSLGLVRGTADQGRVDDQHDPGRLPVCS